jgi:outer membrane receptor protein involved in Fe transport
MGMTKHAAILWVVVAAAPAAAENHAPRSLHMRAPRPPGPAPLGRRVAQVPDALPPSDPPVPPPPPPPLGSEPRAAVAAAHEDGKLEVISVTDSTVEHKLLTGRAPVSIVTRGELTTSGKATLGDVLQALPVQSNAGNAQVNAGGDGTTRINLRGLGAPRTLVLVNGRRMVNGGAGADAAVDVNAIPLAMIERVEIWKDGASAIYGADAVGGVVNLVTRPQFDGTEVSLLTSTSQRGDGTEYDASFVTGFTTKDRRSYLVVSAGHQRHDPVFAGDRGFSSSQQSYDFATKTATRNGSLAAPGGRLDASSLGAGGTHPPGCATDVCSPDGHGTWSDFVAPRDLYDDAAGNYLYTPSSRYNIFATAGKQISDRATLLIEVLYVNRKTDRQLAPVAFTADSPISKASLYNPLGGDILDYRRRITELGPRQFLDSGSTIRLVTGVEGKLPAALGRLADWTYEVSYNFGVTQAFAATTGQLLKTRVADALGPSMLDASGAPICVRTPGDPRTQIVYTVPTMRGDMAVPCVPLNLLAPAGAIPRDQLANLTYTDAGTGTDRVHTVLATTGGRVAELPDHGDISVSLGADYRQEDGELIPPNVAGAGDTTDNAAQRGHGQFGMFEGFGELAVVPVADHGLAQWVELDLGARAVRHDHFGSSLTYKAGGLVRSVGGVALRGTYATAFRAPSLPDVFSGRVERTPSAEDPCDTRPPSAGDGTRTLDPAVQAACTAQGVPVGSRFTTGQQLAAIGGNPSLTAETAATATLGLVVEPPRIKGLAFTVDYWHIAIDHAIEALGIQTIFANCYDRGVQSYCDQIHRDSITHRITSVEQILQNVTRTTTSGVDVALWYDAQLAELGRIHTGLEAQYLRRYDLATPLQVVHGAGFYDLGVNPRYKANASSNWIHPSGASGGFTVRFIGTYKECAGNDCNTAHNLATASRDVDRYVKLDVFSGYDFRSAAGKSTLQLGVNNVFDATPPVVYNAAAANSDAASYDFVGRLVYLRLSQLF